MPCRKRLAASPVGKQTAKIHRNDSAGADVDDSGSYEDGFEGSDDDDDDYQPHADQDESERNDSSTPEEDSEEADYPPRKTTIIPYEELRPLDGIEYSDTRVHRNTLLYLNNLRTNNNRAWFKSKNATAPMHNVIF